MMYILIGLITGIASGMGFGGGSILIIILTAFLGFSQLHAQGINLLFFIPIGALALAIHFKNATVDKKAAGLAIGFGIIGAILGSVIARTLASVNILHKLFALAILIIGITELFAKSKRKG